MDNSGITTSDLLRMIGIMSVLVGAAWALQVLGFGSQSGGVSQLVWVLGAAAIAGAGVGTLYTAMRMGDEDHTAEA